MKYKNVDMGAQERAVEKEEVCVCEGGGEEEDEEEEKKEEGGGGGGGGDCL